MANTTDLTTGRVSRAILQFYFPLLASALLQQFYSFADTAIVGRGLGDNALAAVGNMGSLCFLIFGFSMGLANGFSVIAAQHYGEKNYAQLRRTLRAMIQLGIGITVLLTALSIGFLRQILLLLQTDSLILHDSLVYGYVIFGGLFASIAYNMSGGILRALGDSRTPLKAIILSSVLNIGLDSLFIFVLHTGVAGAAAATVVSQIISAAVCIRKLRSIDFLRRAESDERHSDGTDEFDHGDRLHDRAVFCQRAWRCIHIRLRRVQQVYEYVHAARLHSRRNDVRLYRTEFRRKAL